MNTKEQKEKNPWHALQEHHRLLLVATGLLLLGGAVSWWYLSSVSRRALQAAPTARAVVAVDTGESVPTAPPPPLSAQWYRRLDGMPAADEATANVWPVGVMIENLVSVRPQSGISGAAVVYETLAESGVTRFLVFYNGAGGELPKIGPVRSARAYYVDWVVELGALYAHAGGSPQALGAIRGLAVRDLEGIGREARYFWRDRGLSAPHNLFTRSELLRYALRDKELEGSPATFATWTFADEAPLEARGAEDGKAAIAFSSRSYDVEWRYRREGNFYTRFNGGAVHTDRETGAELMAKNVVIQRVRLESFLGEKGRIDLQTTGEGPVTILHDGKVFSGTWKKPDRASRTLFFDTEGKSLTLVRGTTWVEVVPEDREVSLPS